jgi:hypothetical protein
MAFVSASVCWLTVVVTTPASSEASATKAGLLDAVDETLQSSVILVVPALTPAIKVPTTCPVPEVTLTLQGGPATRATVVAEARVPAPTVKPPMSATDTDATTRMDENLERIDPEVPLYLFIIFIFLHPCCWR